MNYRTFFGAASAAFLTIIVILVLGTAASAASKYETLYKFKGKADGAHPIGSLIFDQNGNLYGTTATAGKLSRPCDKGWRPLGLGCGTVFQLTPNPDGSWKEKVLYEFKGRTDGDSPRADLTFDETGNLYGTTYQGGRIDCGAGCGTVFQLIANPDGSWSENLLHMFFGRGTKNGRSPIAGLTSDQSGNLYGTANPVIFKLTPNLDGSWKYSVLHSFSGKDGWISGASLIFDQAGSLYGTMQSGGKLDACPGGAGGCGVVFKLTP